MTEAAREEDRPRWGTMLGLAVAAILLSVLDVFPLVVLPLALLLMAVPAERRAKWMVIGGLLWVVGMLLSAAPLAQYSRAWALLIGAGYLLATLRWPGWSPFPRMLFAVAIGLAVAGSTLAVTGEWTAFDATMREHFRTISSMTAGDLQARMPDSPFAREFGGGLEQMAEVQWTLFPGLLALQSLAALGLVTWWFGRLRPGDPPGPRLRPLREFRFNDQLVWVVVAGLVLVALPLEGLATRAGYNALAFMAGLYWLRGVGVFLFLIGTPTVLTVVLTVLALLFLYPFVLTAVLLVGLGDTWLDVRRRAMAARRA